MAFMIFHLNSPVTETMLLLQILLAEQIYDGEQHGHSNRNP